MGRANAGWRAVGAALVLLASLAAYQRPFREFPGTEYNDFPLPHDWQDKSEWAFARLMYPPSPLWAARIPEIRGLDPGPLQLDHRLSA